MHVYSLYLRQLFRIFKLIFYCVKSFQIRSYFWSVSFCSRIEYGDLRSKSPYSIQIQENTDQKEIYIWTLFTQQLVQNRSIQLALFGFL